MSEASRAPAAKPSHAGTSGSTRTETDSMGKIEVPANRY